MEARKDLLDVILGKMTVRPGASLTCSSSGKQQQQYQHQQLEEQDRVENQSKKSKTWRRDPPRGLTGATGRVDWRACFGRNARQSPIARETRTPRNVRSTSTKDRTRTCSQASTAGPADKQTDGTGRDVPVPVPVPLRTDTRCVIRTSMYSCVRAPPCVLPQEPYEYSHAKPSGTAWTVVLEGLVETR